MKFRPEGEGDRPLEDYMELFSSSWLQMPHIGKEVMLSLYKKEVEGRRL